MIFQQLQRFLKSRFLCLVLMIYNLFKTILNPKQKSNETELKFWIPIGATIVVTLLFETELTDIQFEGKFKETLENKFSMII